MIPIDLIEISIFLALSEILLLITTQLSTTFYNLTGITIDKKKLDYASLVTGALFLTVVVIRILEVIQKN